MLRLLQCLIIILFYFFSVVSYAQSSSSNYNDDDGSKIMEIEKIMATPNPFSVTTRINFISNAKVDIIFCVKDLIGNTVYTKKIKTKIGKNSISFFRNQLASGIYIYSVKTGNEVFSKRLVIK
ncbi:MAG: hypothetical protein CR985_02495 [Flavobacteriales bacterium]|nr:MAG: hypothetical protein CR985_02495 [Flavobacteriales bacterium]